MKSIEKKIIGIFVCMLMIGAAPIVGMAGDKEIKKETMVNDYTVTVYRTDASGIDFGLSVNDFNTEFIDVEGRSFERLSLASNGHTAEYGKAELPVVSFYVAVPQGAEVDLSYDTSDYTLLQDYDVYPSQPPMPDTQEYIDPPFTINETFYSLDEYYPYSVVEVSPIMVMRGCRMSMVSVFPFAYNPVTKTLKVYNDIDINIDFVGGTDEFIPDRYRSIYFQPLFDAFLLNANSIERATLNIPQLGILTGDRADLLIVVYDEFYEEILPLAEWRHSAGIETKVVKWSEIGNTSGDLRKYVNNSYYNWELPLSFLLIVGDADHVPVNYLYGRGTDHWYVSFEGNDYLPEVHEGRISVDNEDQLNIVVNKILDYGISPYMEENWFDDILLAATEEEERYFIWTSETIYNYITSVGYNVNRQYQDGNPPGSTQGVIDAINSGVIIANHRDHGDITKWCDPEFTTYNIINDLDNGAKYPVMFSINCKSGWFDAETSGGGPECLAEIALRVDNGFVAVLAHTRVSWSGLNDELNRGFYDGMFSDFDPDYPNVGSANPYTTEVFKISQIMNYGKFWMYDKYVVPGGCPPYPWTPSRESSRATFEMLHDHGDPTMEIWTAFPQNLIVEYSEYVPFGPSVLEVIVINSENGDLIEGALVCVIQGEGLYAKNLTDASGKACLDIALLTDDDLSIIVTSHNFLHHSGSIAVNTPPEIPCKPSGQTNGKPGHQYLYTTNTTDLDENRVFYNFSWGDGNYSNWIGPYNSGETASAKHTWNEGTYEIKVKAKDTPLGEESNWSKPLEVSMPKRVSGLFFDIIEQYFPRLYMIIETIINY